MKPIRKTSKRWWRVLPLLLMCLIGGSSPTLADKINEIEFTDGRYTDVNQYPKASTPFFEMRMIYYDWATHHNCFWKSAPEIYVDGVKVCNAKEIGQYYDGGSGAGTQAKDDAYAYDSWWGNAYDKTDNGITYRVRFRDPYESNKDTGYRKFSCYMRVYISSMESGSTHSVTIKGTWCYNGNDEQHAVDKTYTFTVPTLWDSSHQPSAEMTDYQTIKATGKLNKDVGKTKLGFLKASDGKQPIQNTSYYTRAFVNPASLEGLITKDKGATSYNDLTGTHSRNDQQQYDGTSTSIEYAVQLDDNSFTTHYYKWYDVSLEGCAKPTNLVATDFPWSKRMKLEWGVQDSDRFTKGTWTIKRDGQQVADKLSYNIREWYDESPAWDTNHRYELYFVPDGTTTTYNSLKAQATNKLTRVWNINKFTAAIDEDESKITLTWEHDEIADAKSSNTYTLTLWRAFVNDQDNWTKVTDITINSSDVTNGSHTEETRSLQSNRGYIYKLTISVLEQNYEVLSNAVTVGGSKIKSFKASRGTYSNVVKLQWTVKQVGSEDTEFTLYRRPLGSTNESDWHDIYSTRGQSTTYSYEDVTAPSGSYCEYRIAVMGLDDKGNTEIKHSDTADGFTFSSGVISGRITYGTGMAVEGVRVALKQQDGDGEETQNGGMHSLRFSGSRYTGLCYQTDTAEIRKLFGGDFTLQMYLRPVFEEMAANNTRYMAFDSYNVFSLYLRTDADNRRFEIQPWLQGYKASGIYIPAGEWSHVTIVHSRAKDSLKVVVHRVDTTLSTNMVAGFAWTDRSKTANSIAVANSSAMNAAANYRGYVDEVRFFTKALTDKEIERNYNHPLAGNEEGLAIYYPLDEGLENQTIAYDFSKTDGVSNGRHASTLQSTAQGTDVIPSEEQLCLMAYTDVQGNYTVRGIPFKGDGTAYTITPQLGTHEFSPAYLSRFVSASSLVHSGVDFSDISSFPVSGTVYYAGTTYPVEGVNFAIDGVACAKEGKMIESDADGNFTISVPIGKHYIMASKSGHVFVNEGRYPADPDHTGEPKELFNKPMSGLEFRDATLVNFTGRVVGGEIEADHPVGFGLSRNNIGVTQMVVTPVNTTPLMNAVKVYNKEHTAFWYEADTAEVTIPSATELVASTSWRGAGMDNYNRYFIQTDPETGEFSAMLPPLMYKVSDMTVVKTGLQVGASTTIDLTNPLLELSDTLWLNGEDYELYPYIVKLNQVYHSEPTFTVKQDDRSDGGFGIKTYKYKDALGESLLTNTYTPESHSYKYGHPLFVENDPYVFFIEGYEQYVNPDKADDDEGKVSRVPLKDVVVTIENALSSDQTIFLVTGDVTFDDGTTAKAQAGEVYDLKSNQLVLDSLGQAFYLWHAGMPNVSGNHTRTISMAYDISDRQYLWDGSGMTGIIIGDLPTGNNFVTSGPDEMLMILRDPPGTGSSAEWSTGTVTSRVKLENNTWSDSANGGVTLKAGMKKTMMTGVLAGVGGSGDITCTSVSWESKHDVMLHATVENSGETGETIENTVSVTQGYTTSDAPDYVGAYGDVFIGQATNIIFGNARHVGFQRKDDDFDIGVKDVISTGLDFGTTFAYTQGYIEDYLLPNLQKVRNSKLQTVTLDSINAFDHRNGVGMHDLGQKVGNLYFTTLAPDDEHYGENGTYTVIVPRIAKTVPDSVSTDEQLFEWCVKEKQCSTDSVRWLNCQIKNWKNNLAFNEMEKVRAFRNRDNKDSVKVENYSFNGGASFNYSIQTDSTNHSTWEWSVSAGVLLGYHHGHECEGTGVDVDVEVTANGGRHESRDSIHGYSTTYSYTLAEEGIDALSVDVYRYGAFSPIFRTRGGQTSNPHEGEVRTTYYEEDGNVHPVIMEATMQIEVPQIDVDVNTVSDIPTGTAANYTLRLGNASEIGADVTYKLFMLDETNPDGAQLSMDGKVLTEGRLVKVPGNQTIAKALQLRQTDTSILNYEGTRDEKSPLYGKGIGIVFASESQPEEIADTIFIKAYFTPSSSPVTLALSNTTINTMTGTDLTLTFSGFDRNYHNLKAFRLQYKEPGATDWTLLKEYVLDSLAVTQNNELLPKTGASVSYMKDMSSYSDGNYLFRVVSAATYGTSEVYRYSDEIAVVKDTMKPRQLGLPEPSDGILDIGDILSVTFSEPILYGDMSEANNFTVTGVLNGYEVAHSTALAMKNAEGTATTEATITLANKDFSIDAWVNINGQGTILSHGTAADKLTVSTDDAGHLIVDIAGSSYTSTNTLPQNDWVFLTLNYTASSSKLSAYVASTDGETRLFNNQSVPAYKGSGPLSVGKQMKGAIHELLLWDEAHDMTTALMNRSKSKNPSTRHLIGYWKMNEGEGTTIRDYARNRHMKMNAETWHLENVNKAVSLDGQSHLAFMAATAPYATDDDYAIELWMRADKQQGEAQLIQAGEISLWVDTSGQLQLTSDSVSYTTSSGSLTDNVWHHVALNVLRQGAAAVYVDGERKLATKAANIGYIAADSILVGARRSHYAEGSFYSYDRHFKGQVDEVRVWDASLIASQLTSNRKVRLTGNEDGLVFYYPFETKRLNTYSQIETVGTNINLATGDSLQMMLKSAPLDPQSTTLSYTDEAPALREKPVETNVNFNYVASDTKVVIEIDEEPTTIEGCTLNFVVRNVRDANGNYSEPAVWSAFVNCKELVWKEDVITAQQQVETSTTLTATIVNRSGAEQLWTLSGMPAWLQASSEIGSTSPASETVVTFTVSEATPIGNYEETIYLKGNNGIETPLTLNIKVTGDVPQWAFNKGDYEESMNFIGSLYFQNVPSNDTDDIVAAFINGECRGVAQPEYRPRYDSYFVTMDIYANADEADALVEFKMYDASTGTAYPVVKAYLNGETSPTTVTFESNSLLGRYATPVRLDATDEVEQSIELGKGWNWMALGVKPEPFTVERVFEKANGSVEFVKSNTQNAEFDGNDWLSQITAMNNREMYAVQTTEPTKFGVTGHRVNPADEPITVNNGWSWVAYNQLTVMSLADALADMQPQDDEIIKGQRGVAYYDNYEWSGSLHQLSPGQGYKIFGKQARTFTYPATTAAPARATRTNSQWSMVNDQWSMVNSQPSMFTPVDYHNYPANMVVIAQVVCGSEPVANAEVGIFAGDECREAAVTDDRGMIYVTVPGNEPTQLSFVIVTDGKTIEAAETITYENDAVCGTPRSPFIIDLGNATAIHSIGYLTNSSDNCYDLQGRRVNSQMVNSSNRQMKGVYIINGQKSVK